MLPQKTIVELQEIMRSEFDLVLTQQEASDIAHAYVGYFDSLALANKNHNSTERNAKRRRTK